MTGPACGNNPHYQMSDGDRRVVDDFKAYLAARAALRDRIAAAMARADGWAAAAETLHTIDTPAADRYRRCADAVLADLPRRTAGDVAAVIGPTMLLGLQDAELDGEGGTQRIHDWIKWISEAVTALPAVLPATTNHDDVAARTLASLEKVTDRARRAEAEVKRLRTMYNASEARVNDLIDERDQLLETRTDRAVVLREAADEIAGIDFHPNARARSLDIAAGLVRRLRRMGDETPASTAPLAAGLPLVKGHCPACGTAGLFLGNGGYVTCSRADCPEPDAASTVLEQPAAGARQDGAQP